MKKAHKILALQQTEYRSATLALTPMMLAERDREYLKQCRRCKFDSTNNGD